MLKISDCMKHKVVSISPDASIREAANLFTEKHVGTLVVVDPEKHLLGLLPMRDLISLAIPNFIDLFKKMDFIHDFGMLEQNKPEAAILKKPVRELMSPAVSVEADTGLLHAAALLQEHHLNDLPVINPDGKLIGLVSYTDIGVAMLSNWEIHKIE
jgi:CBS domain-containing membrane protein